MKYFSIDRFEGKFVVCVGEDEKIYEILKSKFPKEAREGDIVKILDDGKFVIDEEKTKEKREEMEKLQEDLFSD